MAVATIASASTGVVKSLLGKLATLMREEYHKIRGVRNKVVSLHQEFNSMHALLLRLAEMDELDAQAKQWRDQVREMSYDIEDCIDDFIHDLEKKGTSTGFLKKSAQRLKKIMVRHQIANKIEGIEIRVKEVNERRMRYKLDDCTPTKSSAASVDPRALAIYAKAVGFIGVDAPREELVGLLMGEGVELKVASIVGFGGLGKTTLANQVRDKIQGQFDCHAFFSVSQNPDILGLLNNLLFKLTGEHCSRTSKLDDVINRIRKHLLDKRYFIIIDDLWDPSAWEAIRCAFPENKRGSRLVTTTRIHSVAVACCIDSREYVYKMKPLSDQDSRRLFVSRIFGSEKALPDAFEEFSTDILKRCGGLPLAIISISSLLADQPTSRLRWDYVRNSLGSMFEGNLTLGKMKQILDLSYRNLPHHLKTCLLYVAMYPEDYEITKHDLLRKWVAEGFVSRTRGLDAEDVAESYFNELINMSMIQPVKTDYNDEVLSCRVHDIMLDLIRCKSTEENFTVVIGVPEVLTEPQKKIRRVSIQYDGGDGDGILALSQVRSVTVFRSVLPSFLAVFKYVRVLHFEYQGSRPDLTGICRLFLLRYLKIAVNFDGYHFELPSQIGELQQLETIELHMSYIMRSVPSEVCSLPRLCHLILPIKSVFPDGIGRLKSLRTIKWFDISTTSVDNIKSLGELTNLRDLEVIWWVSDDFEEWDMRMDALRSSLESLSCSLRCFIMRSTSKPNPPVNGWSSLSRTPRHLRKLDLFGCVSERFPMWIAELHDLYSLELIILKMDDGISILGGLPSLAHLVIINRGGERAVISGSDRAFPALRYLFFCARKMSLAFEARAMPRLQTLSLRWRLEDITWTSLPVGMEHLPAGLKEIKLRLDDEDCRASKERQSALHQQLKSVFAAHHPGTDINIRFHSSI